MMKRILIALVFSGSLFHTAFGQVPSFEPYFLLKKNESVQIHAIFQDRNGFMWFGTSKGLFRFNGKSYQRFTVSDSLPDNQVTAIAQDSTGKIWTGHKNGSLAFIEGNRAHRFETDEGPAGGEISDMLFDRSGRLWFATLNDGLYYLRNNRLYRLDEEDGMPDLFIYDIAEDKQGRLWAGTDGGIAICRSSADSIIIDVLDHQKGLPDNIVKKIGFDDDQSAWLATEDAGMIHYEPATAKFENMSRAGWSHGPVSDFLLVGKKIWIATSKSGLVVYDREKDHSTLYNARSGISLPAFSVLTKDREQNVWGGSKSGVLRTMGDYLQSIESFDPYTNNSVLAVTSDQRHHIWYSTNEGLFDRSVADDGTITIERPLIQTPYKHYRIISLYADPFGSIWAGLYGEGLLRIPVNGGKVTLLSKELRNGNVLNITGKGNLIWLATLGGSEQITIQGDRLSFRNYNRDNGLSSDFIYQVFIDSQDRVWFATDGKGTDMLDANGFHHFENGLPSKVVYGFAEDSQHTLWVNVQGNGLYKLQGNEFRPMEKRSRLRDTNINIFSSDRNGNLVVMHDLGIDIFDPVQSSVHQLGEESGLRNKIATLNGVSHDAMGNLLIGTDHGIIQYATLDLLSTIEPLVQIEGVRILNQKRDATQVATLRYNENSITINFVGLWYQNPESLQFQFKVDNYDDDWISTGDNAVTYSQMPPGTYTFHVRVTDHGDFSHALEDTLAFTIKPPFWRTTTFYILSAVVVLALVYSVIKFRERQLKQDKLELEAKVEERTLEIQRNNEEIMAQNEEITAQAEEIKGINENLELIVQQRTLELERKNKALEEYAFINAHKLRSPLASILGLINLISKTKLDDEAKEINRHLQQRAEELDDIVHSITKAIERGDWPHYRSED